MKIKTLVENNSCSENLISEHGLSLYVETENHKILFDTGKTDLFIQNAEKLNIDLKEVDTVVISHGHYDHLGGLIHFLNTNQKAKVHLKKEIFDYQYFSVRQDDKKQIGYPPDLIEYENRFEFLTNACTVSDNLIFIANIDKNYPLPKGNKILFKQKNNRLIHDNFQHELIFAIKTKNGLIVFCGCAHNGILNTVSTVQRFLPNETINSVIGGFHLIDQNQFFETETESELLFIAEELKRLTPETTYYTGHCTGNNAFKTLASVLNNKLQKLNTL